MAIKVDAFLDAGGFLAGIKQMDAGVLSFVNTCKAFTTILPGLGALITAFESFKGAVASGAHLENLSAQTGESVANLAILQQAFRNSGVAAEAVRPLLQKFQANLADASDGTGKASHALDKLGVSAAQLRSQSAVDQIQTLQGAIGKISDQADKAQVLRDLFGKKGGSIASLIGDPNAIPEAKAQLGSLPAVLEQMAPAFHKIEEALAGIGQKFAQFAAGAMEGIAPALGAALAELSHVDLTGLGEALGSIVGTVLDLLQYLTPLLRLVTALSNSFSKFLGFHHELGGKSATNNDQALPLGISDSAPVSHLASVGGSYGNNAPGLDLSSRIDRTNDLLADIRAQGMRARPAGPAHRPDPQV